MLALLHEQRRSAPDEHGAPPVSLPLRVQPSRASALGWSHEVFALTLLIGNASFRQEDGALLPRGDGPVVAVCAEYERPLTSLGPPTLAPYSLVRARLQGMPTLRLPGGWFRAPLRLEVTRRGARMAARHGKKSANGANASVNFAFFDGHVALFPSADYNTPPAGSTFPEDKFSSGTIFWLGR